MKEEINPFESDKFKQVQAIKKLTNAFSPALQKGFCYGSLRNVVLTFYFSHPVHVNEFLMQKSNILEKMRKLYKDEKMAEVLRFKEVRGVVKSHAPTPAPPPKRDTSCKFEERSSGEFEIRAESPMVREAFEKIQKTIKEKRNER